MSNIYYWFLHGCRPQPGKDIIGNDPEKEAYRKSIGNWFATEEEAVKARKKLEALQRIKNNKTVWDGILSALQALVWVHCSDELRNTDPTLFEDFCFLFYVCEEEQSGEPIERLFDQFSREEEQNETAK